MVRATDLRRREVGLRSERALRLDSFEESIVASEMQVHRRSLEAMSASLYILMYKAESANYDHWALMLQERDSRTIFEVEGEHPSFTRRSGIVGVVDAHRRTKKCVYIAAIREREIPEFRGIIQDLAIDNETLDWNCQDYVLEGLDEFVEAGIIDDDDTDYVETRSAVVEEDYGAH
ncbi:hypothetical protein FH972_024681 [Carpinus fangiana]|uniref:Uncharacterized protein n=1 Tax=Carpinus fangiana TaxID=176857 RepID=A0A5N6KYP3_9ROSI|nr:hypothetical protein FH972_024681 [Carpinus fangiana]